MKSIRKMLVFSSLVAGGAAAGTWNSAALLSIRGGSSSSTSSTSDPLFEQVSQSKVYDGKYRQILSKQVKFPNSKINTFEVLSNHGLPSVSCFCWDVQNKRCTALVKEYHPGPDKFLWGTINGQYEEHEGGKHSTAQQCAAYELAEEAELEAYPEDFIFMLNEESSSPMDKYTDNKFYPFLVLNPGPVKEENRRAMDDEEYIEVQHGLTYHEIMDLIVQGKINVVSTYTILLGFKTLEKMGIEYK